MLYFDVTKTGTQGHRSGLTRVSERLRGELGDKAQAVSWESWNRQGLCMANRFLTAELFSEAERPGMWAFLRNRPCRCEAIFHDAIPLKRPDITWPHSVARHPEYMKMLAHFDRIWAVSQSSRIELLGFWRWQGIEAPPPVEVLALGADSIPSLPRRNRSGIGDNSAPLSFLSVGILEPRKNQILLLDACNELWSEGLSFELQLVGRVNPHFGKPIKSRIAALQKRFPQLHHHEGLEDQALEALYARAGATLFPTLAEGCGLPLLESLWHGLPCLCSDLPVLRENADAGGCLPVAVDDRDAWKRALRSFLTDADLRQRLAREACSRPLPTWHACAERLATANVI